MGVNATDDGVQTDMGVVFDVPGKDADVLVHPTATGELRALISIESPLAPERYAFPIAGDVARIALDKAGGAVAMDASGVAIAYAPAPWAVDANGTRVPTFFEVDGTTLYQVIRHRGREYTYGVVGDPAWAVITPSPPSAVEGR